MKRAHQKQSEQGFSLIEMMIAAVIFILLCGAAFALLSVAQQRYQTESQVLNSFQEARFGLDDMVRDVNGSGYPPQNQFSFTSGGPPSNFYAITPVAWAPGYPTNSPCQIGTGGGGTCTTPGDFDLIIERDVDYWHTDGVEWTRYQLQGSVLSSRRGRKIRRRLFSRCGYLFCIRSLYSECDEQRFPSPDSATSGSLSANVSGRESSADFQLLLLHAVRTAATVPFGGVLQFPD